MSNAIVSQVPKNLPFRYRIPCRAVDPKPEGLFELPESHRIPRFGAFEYQPTFADLRVGWRDDGLYVSQRVTGKEQSVWCRETQLLASDSLQLWIDTRNTQNIHRASKFCHWMLLMPTGKGGTGKEPMISMLKINRCKEPSPYINQGHADLHSKITSDGYQMSAHIPSSCLFGWKTDDHRMIGFYYTVVDRELGWQTLAVGPEFPIAEDPTLWHTLELVD